MLCLFVPEGRNLRLWEKATHTTSTVYYTDGTAVRDDYIQDNDLGPINDFDAALIRPAIYSLELSDGSAAEIVVYVNTNGQARAG